MIQLNKLRHRPVKLALLSALIMGGAASWLSGFATHAEPTGATGKTTKAIPAKKPSAGSGDKNEQVEAAAPSSTSPVAPPSPPAAAAPPAPSVITARLREYGAGTCAPQIDALAATTLQGVEQFNSISSWSNDGSDKHAVAVAIGQRYAADSKVPYGVTSVVAAPTGQGRCDAIAVEIVPSPLPCDKLRESLSTQGRPLGELAGVPVMQNANGGHTLLVRTAADTCVLVAQRFSYAK